MRSYLIIWEGEQATRSSLKVALQLAEEKKGKIYIADGKYTKELAGIKIYDYLEDEEK